VQSAPAETPQSRKAARVGGCSGVTQVAYPLFFIKAKKSFEKKVLHNQKLMLYFAPLNLKTAIVLYKFCNK
jgi:hypothetical protein